MHTVYTIHDEGTIEPTARAFDVPDEIRTHYDEAKVTPPVLRGNLERDWAMRYVRDAYTLALVTENHPLVERVRQNPGLLDRYVLHALKLEAAWFEYHRPAREATQRTQAALDRAIRTCPVCGEVGLDRPQARQVLDGHTACEPCARAAGSLLAHKAATPERVAKLTALLGL